MASKNGRVPVTDLRTGVTYPSMISAAEALYVTSAQLGRARMMGKTEVVGIPVAFGKQSSSPHGKRCVCVETGEVFQSYTAAAKSVGVNKSAIREAIRRGGKSCGYHWEKVK